MSNSTNIYKQFTDDAIIEIEENLTKIKTELIEFENLIGEGNMSRKVLNQLLIPFHTIKGISGMVGFKEIQDISHFVESYIKFLADKESVFTKEAFDAIFDSIKLTETLLVIYKESKFVELEKYKDDISRLIELLSRIVMEEEVTKQTPKVELNHLSDDTQSEIENYLKQGFDVYFIHFTPSPELYQKGININSFREKLSSIVKIIESKPTRDKDGKIIFEIICATKENLESLDVIKQANVVLNKIAAAKKSIIEISKTVEQTETPVTQFKKFSSTNVIRIELNKIDELINMVGDLVIVRSRLDLFIKNMKSTLPASVLRSLSEINSQFERKIRSLRDGIMNTRLVQIGEIFDRMKFVVRDLVRGSEKQIKLEVYGCETEIDKYVVEQMFDPIQHLVRNSISHGIELPHERSKKGKNQEGRIILNAYSSGDSVFIEISDDGKGIDKSMVLNKAIELGIINKAEQITDAELLEIICLPGFSTQSQADMGSGRGVGMTAVKQIVDELGGKIELSTQTEKGTKFKIHLPLTLAIIDAFIVETSNQTFAIPQQLISELISIELKDIQESEGFSFVNYRNKVMPIIFLNELFDIKNGDKQKYIVLVTGNSSNTVGLVVDKIKTKQEIVVRSLKDPFVRLDFISGATELGDGKAILILDVAGIINAFIKKSKTISGVYK